MNYKRIMRNSKAISPIFATLILIAIAVIAGVVVYMFTSGTLASMTAGGTAGTEKATVQGASINATTGAVKVYAQATNNLDININSVVIKSANGDIVCTLTTTTQLKADGTLTTISLTGATGVTVGSPYSVTLVSAKGGSFVSAQVIAG